MKCEFCDYETRLAADFQKHLKTNKHIQNEKIGKKHRCKTCKYLTASKSNYNAHLKTKTHIANQKFHELSTEQTNRDQNNTAICGNQKLINDLINAITNNKNESITTVVNNESDYQSLRDEIIQLKNENLKLKDEKNELTGIIKNTVEIANKSVDTAKNATETTKKSVNALTFLNSEYPNGPAIELLTNDKFDETGKKIYVEKNKISTTSHSIEEIIIFHYKKKILADWLGGIIVDSYKTEKLEERTIWNSDVSRLTFFIKNLINNTTQTEWIKDCKGYKLKEILIKPILNNIKEKIKKYIADVHKTIEKKTTNKKLSYKDNESLETLSSNMQIGNEIIGTINNSRIQNEILRYIAPHFGLIYNKPKKTEKYCP